MAYLSSVDSYLANFKSTGIKPIKTSIDAGFCITDLNVSIHGGLAKEINILG